MIITLFWLAIVSSSLSHAFLIHPKWRSYREPLPSRLGASTVHKQEPQIVGQIVDSAPSFHQDKAAEVVSSFCPGEFRPIPWLSNPHIQTCVGFFVRDLPECAYIRNGNIIPALQAVARKRKAKELFKTKSLQQTFWDERKRITTPDGDWFHADYKYVEGCSNGLVILLHGLEASSESLLSVDIAEAYRQIGMDVVCLNFRGCSGTPANKPGGYHLGFTQDLKHFLCVLETEIPTLPPIYVSGFSLGGNVVLKALGELGEEAVERFNIKGASIACPPIDAEKDIKCIDAEGFNQRIYAGGLCAAIREKATKQLELFCDGDKNTNLFDFNGVMEAKTIQEIDDTFIAPIFGFEGAIDYYRRSSCYYYLDKIAVPTYILRAKDDPFLDPVVPHEKCRINGGVAPIRFHRTSFGGHLGYTFHEMNGDIDNVPKAGWMASELARFIFHVANLDSGLSG